MQATKTAVILEWAFSPRDYFEAPIRLKRDAYVISLADGKVEVRLDAGLYDQEPSLPQQLHETVNGWFRDAQQTSHRPYRLSQPSMVRVYYDAMRDEAATPPPSLSSTRPRVSDGAPPELESGASAGSDAMPPSPPASPPVAGRYSGGDRLLATLLESYDAAVADPPRELERLGAIAQALAAKLGDVPAQLGIDPQEWTRLAELTAGGASQQDDLQRAQARAIALRAILAYLRRS